MDGRFIVDVGMHNGTDTDFYLKKGFRVLAIEANPGLVEHARTRFSDEIESGQLEIVEGAISDQEGEIEFWINLDQDLWSAIDKNIGSRQNSRVERVVVPSVRFEDLVDGRDDIYYIKSDIEHADIFALKSLRTMRRLPRFFSVESHTLSYLSHLDVAGYNRFKLVNQGLHWAVTLPQPALEGRFVEFKFGRQSSGPFGEESPGPWQSFEEVAKTYFSARALKQTAPLLVPGYFDFHAKISDEKDQWA